MSTSIIHPLPPITEASPFPPYSNRALAGAGHARTIAPENRLARSVTARPAASAGPFVGLISAAALDELVELLDEPPDEPPDEPLAEAVECPDAAEPDAVAEPEPEPDAEIVAGTEEAEATRSGHPTAAKKQSETHLNRSRPRSSRAPRSQPQRGSRGRRSRRS